jgi:hypothetical protein
MLYHLIYNLLCLPGHKYKIADEPDAVNIFITDGYGIVKRNSLRSTQNRPTEGVDASISPSPDEPPLINSARQRASTTQPPANSQSLQSPGSWHLAPGP